MKSPIYNPAWPDDIKALYRHDMREIWDRSIAPHIWNQYHNQLDLYKAIVTDFACGLPQRILDVGCAQATLAMLLAERGHHVTAVDLRPGFLEYARSRHTHGAVDFICGNALELNLETQFDIIFANQIIEHLVYPSELLSSLGRHLRPGGLLVVTTPNWRYFKNSLPSFDELGDVAQYEHMQNTADADGHFYAYRAEELVRILRDHNFTEIKASVFETPFISGHFRVRHFHPFTPAKVLRALDAAVLAFPGIGSLLAHQLMITGRSPLS